MAKRRNRRLRIENLLSQTTEPVFVLNAERELVFVNSACEALMQRPSEQLLGLCCRYHGPQGDLDVPDAGSSLGPPPEVMAGRPATLRSLFVTPNGQRVWRQIQFFPCRLQSETPVAILGLVSEPTAQPVEPESPHTEIHTGLVKLREHLYGRFGMDRILGTGPAMHRAIEQIRLAARCDVDMIIWGEPGTGKHLLARTIHAMSDRRAAPFVPLDCALVPAEWLDRELFGTEEHGKSLTGSARAGLVRAVQGGTLYLKNISRMPRDTQSRLARVLRDRLQERATPGSADVRVIAADCMDPKISLAADQLRSDFYLLLSTIAITVPSLRERKEDLALLAQMFVESVNAGGVKQVSGLSSDALELLHAYDWPQNVRELRDVITEAHQQCKSTLITPDDVTPRIRGARGGAFAAPAAEVAVNLDAMLADAERRLIEQAIQRARGNKSVAAALLSISRPRLYRRMQMLAMDDGDDENTAAYDSLPSSDA